MDRGGNISVDELKGWYSPLGFGKGGGLDKAGQVGGLAHSGRISSCVVS